MSILTGKENHYEFIKRVGKQVQELLELQYNPKDLSVAHGDKVYGYRFEWEEQGIPFNHGALIYLFTRMLPYVHEIGQVNEEWVDPGEWVVKFYDSPKGEELQTLLETLG